MSTGIIFDIKRFAIHDGPGIRTTVFLKGCPLSCWWCHNPESRSAKPDVLGGNQACVRCGACVEACPQGARSLTNGGGAARDEALCTVCGTCVEACPAGALEIVGQTVTVDELMSEIEKDTPFFDQSGGGVTFSGGEPLGQPDFLINVLDRCAKRDLHTAVDTCGFAETAVLRAVAGRTDLFLFDLKFMASGRHLEITGVDNDLILGNLKLLSSLGKDIHIRVPVIPGVTDGEANIEAMGCFLAALKTPPSVTLLPHHTTAMGKYARFDLHQRLPAGTGAPSPDALAHIAAQLQQYDLAVIYQDQEGSS